MQRKTQHWKRQVFGVFLLLGLFAASIASIIPKPAYAVAPSGIVPGSGTLTSDYTFELVDNTPQTNVNFATNFYADEISIYGTYVYFDNIALGSASNAAREFGIGMEDGDFTITAIGSTTVSGSVSCTMSTYCYPFYYYDINTNISEITVGSTSIPVQDFYTDFATFSVSSAPAVYWNSADRYYEVKVFYTGATTVSFAQNTGGGGLSPVSWLSTSTITSLSSDPDFQQVYEDGTDRVIFLDAEMTNGTLIERDYDVATGTTTNTSVNVSNGGDTVDTDAFFSPVEINDYVWTIGRDSGTGNNVYALRTTNALSAVNATSQTSSYFPRDLTQSATSLHSPLYEATTYGKLYLGTQTRAYGSYAETALYTGTNSIQAYGIPANQTISGSSRQLGTGTSTIETEKFTSTAALVGSTISALQLSLSKTGAPTGTAIIGVFNDAGSSTTTFDTLDVSTLTGSELTYTFVLDTDYVIQSGDRIGIQYSGDGNGANLVRVHRSPTDVYDGTNAVESAYSAGWTDTSSADMRFGMQNTYGVKSVVYNGSPDTVYTFFESGASSIRVVKYASSATLLGTSMSHTAGEPFKVIQLTDKMLIQTATDTYVLNTATDTITEIYGNTFNTRYAQTFELSPSARTFNSNTAFIANSTYAINFTPNLGTGAQTGVIIDSVNDSTGAMNVYAPAKYYYLSENNLTVESSTLAGTTWTISALGDLVQIAPTAYTEQVGVSLVQNSTIFSENVIDMVCGVAAYHLVLPMVAIGDDSACTAWNIYDINGGAAARELSYARTSNLVHASDYTYYTFNLSVADPTQYSLETSYDAKTVDTGDFDSAGQLQQRLLYQQCYTISVEEILTGNSVQTGNVCAGDDLTKTISLSGIVIPPDWLGTTWSHVVQRNFTHPGPTNNGILYSVQKSTTPYNASIHIVDHPDSTLATYDNWFNFTNALGISIANVTGINSNQTLFFTVYENGVIVINDVSSGMGSFYDGELDGFGLLFGVPIAVIFPILTAALFPKSQSHIGIIATGAVIGILQFFGFFTSIPFNEGLWAVAFGLIAIGVMLGSRR